eukprot:COSAG06_NODE_18594_length_878_cov_1.299101_1_plen_61_part_10
MPSFCQDRLGTNIGRAEKKAVFSRSCSSDGQQQAEHGREVGDPAGEKTALFEPFLYKNDHF